MVISVFPDVSQGFARYEQSRRARLQDQALRTQNNMMLRRQAAFRDMVAGLEGQERTRAEAMGLDYVPFAIQQDAAQQAAMAEQEAARREQIQQYGMGVATRRRQLAQQEGFNEDEFLRQAYDFGRSEYGMQMPYEQFVERARNPMAGEMPDVAGRDYNLQYNDYVDPSGAIVQERRDPRTDRRELRYLDGSPYQGDPRDLRSRSGQTINVGGPAQLPPGEVSSTEALANVIDLEGIFQAADRAPGELRRIEAAREALADPDLRTGFGGEIRTQLGSLALTLGASDEWVSENIQAVGPAENFRAVQNIAALALRNPDSGFGLTGNTSNRDVQFLLAAVPGLNNTREANQLLLDIMEQRVRVQQSAAEIAMRHMEGGSYNPLALRRDLSRYYASEEVTNAASQFRQRGEELLRQQYNIAPDIWGELSDAEKADRDLLRAISGQGD